MTDLQNLYMNPLPPSLSHDQRIVSVMAAVDKELREIAAKKSMLYIIANIDSLPEKIINLLAWQWHVDFWSNELPLDRKRELVKNSIRWHRIKGTPAAVEEVVTAAFGNGVVEEWFEYGGEPYYFRIRVNGFEYVSLSDLRAAINSTKNTRSWLEKIIISISDMTEAAELDEDFMAQVGVSLKDSYPWPGLRLDGTWSLHDVSKLDGTWPLNAGRRLNGHLPVPPGVPLDSKVDVLGPFLIRPTGFHDKPEARRLLDGRWLLDGQHILGNNPAPIDASGDITVRRYRRLDGKWGLDGGDKNLLNGSFPLDGRAGLDGGGIRLGITKYMDTLDGKLQLQHIKKISPVAERHPVFREEMSATDQSMILRQKVALIDEATAGAVLNGDYFLNGAITLGKSLLPHEIGGGLQIVRKKWLNGTWLLDGGAVVRLDGSWSLNGNKLLYGGGTRLEIKRRIEEL